MKCQLREDYFAGEYDIIKITYEDQTISTEAAMTIGCITGSESLIQYARDPKVWKEEDGGIWCLEVYVDPNLIEVFVNKGEAVISNAVYQLGEELEIHGNVSVVIETLE